MNIKIYTTPTCPFCHQLKEFLLANNIAFEEVDVSKDRETIKDFIARTGQTGVPVIEIDGKLIFGFDKSKISAILGI